MRISDWSSDVCSSDLTLGDQLEQQFGAGLGERHKAQFVDDEQLVSGHLLLEAQKTALVAGLHHFADQRCRGGEAHRQSFLACCKSEPQRYVRLSVACWPQSDGDVTPPAPLATLHLDHPHHVEPGDGGRGLETAREGK